MAHVYFEQNRLEPRPAAVYLFCARAVADNPGNQWPIWITKKDDKSENYAQGSQGIVRTSQQCTLEAAKIKVFVISVECKKTNVGAKPKCPTRVGKMKTL